MGIGDSISKAAENAMEDLAGTSKPTEGTDVPEPTDPNSDVEVHSSISEGSNAMEAEKEKAPGLKPGSATGPVSANPVSSANERGTTDSEATGTPDAPRDVPGPAGLPEGDPGELRADPGEGDEDPSTGLGRG
ncbi:hypothetical protein [Pseudarthrobacter sp. BIM B-2242]|uniref:hypothetical protein n=1 Tax=Pseudarthrobacter sp. BIM B-2242 TaxID=2772401 RepID=UPI00168BF51F|nr:hypothetical protein [Pseudarthrobacter sp. BIM B-2242]QOD03703.1 hypothetical protein IDT60_00870 [Pseudarthrobacter sp. BIM B-2242]